MHGVDSESSYRSQTHLLQDSMEETPGESERTVSCMSPSPQQEVGFSPNAHRLLMKGVPWSLDGSRALYKGYTEMHTEILRTFHVGRLRCPPQGVVV